jgi:peptidoglycan/LPS O-acetylase OafA/YrhL
LRGIAATLVLANHCFHTLGSPRNFGAPPFGLVFQFGRAGADLFFVLSGFLIALIHWRDIGRPARLGHYLARRVTRIYPTYWLVMFAIIPVDAMTRTLFGSYDHPIEVVKSLLLLPQDKTMLDVTWSLRNELVFYALFGLLIVNRALGAIAASAWILLLVGRPVLMPEADTPFLNLLTYPMNFEFLAGAAAGWAVRRHEVPRPGAVLAAGLTLFAVFAVAEDRQLLWTNEPHLWFAGRDLPVLMLRCLGYGLASMLIIAGAWALERAGRLTVPGFLVRLGGASYLLYLIHVPALILLAAAERHVGLLRFMPAWLLAALCILAIVAAALVLNEFVERPLLTAIRPRATTTRGVARSAPV